ncbi:MAG: hypothetical protein HZA59_12760 [Hydrogenophilales bacterium]|nr:hypothetical protein [Hydrogenophilales bacterium]
MGLSALPEPASAAFCFAAPPEIDAQLREAEHAALPGLKAAAQQGGFSGDWTQLDTTSAAWSRVDGTQHFYLFTLKALAFTRLRLDRFK